MDSNIVCIDDLKEYDDKIRNWISRKYVQIGANSTIPKPKISIVTNLPTNPDVYTIYFVKNDPENYIAVPNKLDFTYNNITGSYVDIKNSATSASVSPNRAQMLNGSHFDCIVSGGRTTIKPKAVNVSGSTYTDTARIYFNNLSGTEIYIDVPITQASGSAETYSISPTSKTFGWNDTSEQSFQVTNSSGVLQTIKSVSLSGGNSNKFTARYSGTTAYCKSNGNNTSGSNYTTTLIVTATTPDGDKTFNVSIIQSTGVETYTINPTSKTFNWNDTSKQNFVVTNSSGVAQNIKHIEIDGSDRNKFDIGYLDTNAYCKPSGNNTSGADYNAIFTVVAQTPDGDKTFDIPIVQKSSGETYTIRPTSKAFDWNNTNETEFKIVNSSSVEQSITNYSITGSNANKFRVRQVGNKLYVKNIGNNTSGSNYSATLNVTAVGQSFTANLTQSAKPTPVVATLKVNYGYRIPGSGSITLFIYDADGTTKIEEKTIPSGESHSFDVLTGQYWQIKHSRPNGIIIKIGDDEIEERTGTSNMYPIIESVDVACGEI